MIDIDMKTKDKRALDLFPKTIVYQFGIIILIYSAGSDADTVAHKSLQFCNIAFFLHIF